MLFNVTVVVGTLDLYSTVWQGLCHGLKKYWPDCPWPIVFITNNLDAPYGKAVKVGGDHTDWTGRMRRGLTQIKSPVILWLTSDNWITARPNVNALTDFVGHVLSDKAAHVWLYPGQDYDIVRKPFTSDARLMVITRESSCRCSLKPSLWRREVFLSLLKDSEWPWEFESNASLRSQKLRARFLTVKDWGYFPFVMVGDPSGDWIRPPVMGGHWTEGAQRYAEREGLRIDFAQHPIA